MGANAFVSVNFGSFWTSVGWDIYKKMVLLKKEEIQKLHNLVRCPLSCVLNWESMK